MLIDFFPISTSTTQLQQSGYYHQPFTRHRQTFRPYSLYLNIPYTSQYYVEYCLTKIRTSLHASWCSPSPHLDPTPCRPPLTMSSTRYQPLQIYQDPSATYDHASMLPMSQDSSFLPVNPLRPIKNAASRKNVIFSPPHANGSVKRSPLKAQSSSSPHRRPFGNKLNMVPMLPPGKLVHNTDSMEKKKAPSMSNFKPQKALFTTFASARGDGMVDKENCPQQQQQQQTYKHRQSHSFHEGLTADKFSLEGLYGPKAPLKRTLMDAAPILETKPAKKIKVDEEVGELMLTELPSPESFAPLIDDGSKPAHSYAQLIGMSILRSEHRRLTLAQIYKWISDTYSHYSATDAGWQNSIRHNLSLNKAFEKQERPKDDPGKGNYWVIKPGMEYQFIKEKTAAKKATNASDVASSSINSDPTIAPKLALPDPQRTPFHPIVPAMPQNHSRQQSAPSLPTYSLPPAPSSKSRAQEPSSDATIPDSDTTAPDQNQEKEAEPLEPSSPLMHSSPPGPLMHSSPPVPRHVQRRPGTPPPVPRFPNSSQSRSTHRRKFQSMDDSGYFSSLDSSAMRYNPRQLTSEADRPRMKRGRAEEEIARLRGSSYDSPTKNRMLGGHQSSSPLRRPIQKPPPTYQMLPPLTPAIKLKAPNRPPPSVSPNTNLRLHRDHVRTLVGSPLRGMTCLDEENLPWSPQFDLDVGGTPFVFHDNIQEYDIFEDPDMVHLGTLDNPFSPEKKSSKRPSLHRSVSANILADITKKHGSFQEQLAKGITSTPRLSFTPAASSGSGFSPVRLSPAKSLSNFFNSPNPNTASPSKASASVFTAIGADFDFNDDFLGAEFLEEDVGFGGLDIMQGFQKIGAGAANGKATGGAGAASGRPALGRSFSTRF